MLRSWVLSFVARNVADPVYQSNPSSTGECQAITVKNAISRKTSCHGRAADGRTVRGQYNVASEEHS